MMRQILNPLWLPSPILGSSCSVPPVQKAHKTFIDGETPEKSNKGGD
jgi:hypothetical protein